LHGWKVATQKWKNKMNPEALLSRGEGLLPSRAGKKRLDDLLHIATMPTLTAQI